METSQRDDAFGTVAGFFLELANRGRFDGLPFLLVADKARRKLEAMRVQRRAPLFDQNDILVDDRQDHRRRDTACARHIFPFSLALGGEKFALPNDLFGFAHSSTRRSGSSLRSVSLFGKCVASTSPIIRTDSAMHCPGRPAFTSRI